MKLTHIITLLLAALFFAGCASNGSSSANEEAPSTGEATATDTDADAGAKTAYEGSTGSGLLMERYKAGSIEGYRE